MSKKKHEWTRKGVTASMAVVMAFGMVPATSVTALAEGSEEVVESAPVVDEAAGQESTAGGLTDLSNASNWISDRTEPNDFSISDGEITFGVKKQPGEDSWYGWQGRKAFTKADFGKYWKVSYTFDVTNQMLTTDKVNQSLWVQVDKQGENDAASQKDNVDWSIIQFLNDGSSSKFQSWDSKGSGSWKDIALKPTEGTYQVEIEFYNGVITQYLNGCLVNSYEVGSGITETAPVALIAQGRSYGSAFDVRMSVPTVSTAAGAVDSDATLRAALDSAESGDTITLADDIELQDSLVVDKSVTIDGQGHSIIGQEEDSCVNITVNSGSFSLKNAKIIDFGGAVATTASLGAIEVPSAASADTMVQLENVDFENFNRAALDVKAGGFVVSDCEIDCANKSPNGQMLSKGICASYNSRGTVENTTITNSSSSYAKWDAAAIEVWDSADVTVKKCTIEEVEENAIEVFAAVDYGSQNNSTASLHLFDSSIDAGEGSVVSVGHGAEGGHLLTVEIEGGKYVGDVTLYSFKVNEDDYEIGEASSECVDVEIREGEYSFDPSAFVPSTGYDVVENADGTYTVSRQQSGGGSVVVPTPTPDEEVTENPDGSVTTTVEGEDGSTVSTTVSEDGSVTTVVEKDKDGNVASVEATVEGDEAPEATVALPMEPIAAASSDEAPEISVKAPAGTKVSVPVAKAEGAEEPAWGCVLVMVGADGSETAMPKTGVSEDGLALEVPGDCALKVVDASAGFPDVEASDWFAGVADFASARNILSGVVLPDGAAEFQGDLGTTRAMFVTMLNRLELEPEPSEGAPSFSDVSEGDWFSGTASWAAGEGLLSGYGDGTFGGGDAVTREQVAVFLMRYAEWLGLDTSARAESAAPDASEVSSWAAEAVSWAVAEGYVLGDEGTGAVRPADGASRAEAAAIVMRFVNSLY